MRLSLLRPLPLLLLMLCLAGCGQTGRLFLPFDVRVGRKLSDNIALSLEIGVPIIRDYPVYNLKTQVRLNVTY